MLGLPVRAPSIALFTILLVLSHSNFGYMELTCLFFTASCLSSVSRTVFIWRYDSHPASSFYHHNYLYYFEEIDLPHHADLLQLGLPSKQVCKAHVKSLLYLQAHNHLISSVSNMVTLSNLYDASLKLKGKPSCIIRLFKCDISLAQLHQFHSRLLLHCSEINADTVSFRPNNNRVRSSICCLCNITSNPNERRERGIHLNSFRDVHI